MNNEDIYILFGDEPRSDGENIRGVYKSLESAKKGYGILERNATGYDFPYRATRTV